MLTFLHSLLEMHHGAFWCFINIYFFQKLHTYTQKNNNDICSKYDENDDYDDGDDDNESKKNDDRRAIDERS